MTETYFIRQKKERDYTVINNTILKDPTVSWKAKGLFVYLLSLPEDWVIYLSEIENHAKDGRDSLRSAIKELTEHGYIKQQRRKDNLGRFVGWCYEIIENPATNNRQEEKPKSENPQSDIPQSENPQLLNTNNYKILNLQNTNEYTAAAEAAAPAPEEAPQQPKEPKHKNGPLNNVLLTNTEKEKLCEEYGKEKTEKAIEHLSLYKAEKGYKTKSDYLTLRRWVFAAIDEKQQRSAPYRPQKPQMTNDIYKGDGSDW